MTIEEPNAQPGDHNLEPHSADNLVPTLSTKSHLTHLHREFCWPCSMSKDSGTFHTSDSWRKAPLVECEHRRCNMQAHQVRHAKGCPTAKGISQKTQRSYCGSCDEPRDLTYVGLEAVPYRSACLVLSQHARRTPITTRRIPRSHLRTAPRSQTLHPMIIEPRGVVCLSRCSSWKQAIAAVDKHLDAMIQPLGAKWTRDTVTALDAISQLDPDERRSYLESLFQLYGSSKGVARREGVLCRHLCSYAGTCTTETKAPSTRATLIDRLHRVVQSEEGRAVIRFWRASLGSMQDGLFRQTVNSESRSHADGSAATETIEPLGQLGHRVQRSRTRRDGRAATRAACRRAWDRCRPHPSTTHLPKRKTGAASHAWWISGTSRGLGLHLIACRAKMASSSDTTPRRARRRTAKG